MAKTKDQVCRLAGRELGLQPTAQAVDGGSFVDIQDTFDNLLADLQGREIIAWGEDETPDECAYAFAVYLAQKCLVLAAPAVKEELRAMGQKPFLDLVAAAGRKWSGASTKVDRF